MSKNEQNTNGRNYNNGGRNFNDRKKKDKQPRVNPNEIKVPLYLPADSNENIIDELLEVLADAKFNKISMPLGTYRSFIDSNVDADDTRLCTIGYIRGYNSETREFTVIVFNNFIDDIKSKEDIVMEVMFTTYKESLGTITKFNIISMPCEDEVEDSDEEVTE